jgi:hypothetical protein
VEPGFTVSRLDRPSALLIGINTYQPQGTAARHSDGCVEGRCDLAKFPNLEGQVNDVLSFRDLLSGAKFGFDPQNIVVLTNPILPLSQRPYVTLPADQTGRVGLLAV